MSSGKRIVIVVHIATNHPIDAYGGIQLPEKVLEELTSRVRDNLIPFVNQHDPTQNLNAICLRADVVDLPDGFKAVEAELEVDAEAWDAVEADWSEVGAPGGMSITFSEPISELKPTDTKAIAAITIAADPSYFSDDDIQEAATRLTVVGSVTAARLYQLAAVPTPRIVIDLAAVLLSIPPGVAAAAIYDCLKHLLPRRKRLHKVLPEPTQIDICTRRNPDGSIAQTVQVRSNDEAVLKHALDKLGDAVTWPKGQLKWEDEPGDWRD